MIIKSKNSICNKNKIMNKIILNNILKKSTLKKKNNKIRELRFLNHCKINKIKI